MDDEDEGGGAALNWSNKALSPRMEAGEGASTASSDVPHAFSTLQLITSSAAAMAAAAEQPAAGGSSGKKKKQQQQRKEAEEEEEAADDEENE